MQFNFPAIPAHLRCKPTQVDKVFEELRELVGAMDSEGPERVIEEYMDTVHALEQIGRELIRKHGSLPVKRGIDYVIDKNAKRGLYDR